MSYLYASDFPFKNFCKLAQHAKAIRKHCLGKSNEALPLWIRVQTTINHFLICFYPVRMSKKMIFSSEREFKKALRDMLMQAAWYELLSTMATCGKI